MADERRPPPRFPRPSASSDDEVVEIPPTERVPRQREPFNKLVQTPAETVREVLSVQRKMALQMDGFGQMVNRRFDLFHEELALERAGREETNARLDTLITLVKGNHAPRLEKVESTLGRKMAKGGGIVGILIVALPLLSDVLPKWKGLFDSILGALQ